MIFAPSTLHASSADLTLTINGIPLPRVKTTKYLGLVIDDKLDWISHIQDLCTLLRKYIGIFYKLSLKLPAKILNMLYFSLIYPRLLYGIEVYANTYLCHLHNLIVLNNRILRIIQHKSLMASTISLYSSLNTLPVDKLFKYQILLHAHNIFFGSKLLPSFFHSNNFFNSDVHTHFTRSTDDFHRNSFNTTFGSKISYNLYSRLWNSLPPHIKSISSLSIFKKILKTYLSANPL